MSGAGLIRQLRERTGLTQGELARRSGTSQPAIARLEAGQAHPSLATLGRLAAAAGFDLELRLVPAAPADPVVARYQDGIDRSLLRRNLRLSMDQRIRELARLQAFHAEVRRAGRAARRGGAARR